MITFSKFRRLVAGGENAFVDFKIACNAFDKTFSNHEEAKAELVKDICAMANNAPKASYLLVGVSDDGKHCKSVSNAHLTSANVQSLIRDSIHPRPKVTVHDKLWSGVPVKFNGKRFVIIQVGPHAKEAYRLNRDYIEPGSGYNFRKHQVWVRNDDTSDIATPEQIFRLKSRNVRAVESDEDGDFQNIEYEKVAANNRTEARYNDLRQLFKELGFKIYSVPGQAHSQRFPSAIDHDFRVLLEVGGRKYLFLCAARRRYSRTWSYDDELKESWNFEHGILAVLHDNVDAAGRPRNAIVDYRMPWGWYSGLELPVSLWALKSNLEKGSLNSWPYISFVTLTGIINTASLKRSVTAMLNSLGSDLTTFAHLDGGRKSLERCFRTLRKRPWKELKEEFEVAAKPFGLGSTLRLEKYLRSLKALRAPR